MKVLNLFAGPSGGKSTTAAFLFSSLKNKGYNVELVTEYAKDLVYSSRQNEMTDQVYLLAKQHKRLNDIKKYEKVPLVITDCPLPMSLVYARQLDISYYDELHNLTYKLFNNFDNINVFLHRNKPYNPSGRNQTEEESDEISKKIHMLMQYHYYEFGDEEGQKRILDWILNGFEI